MVARFDARYVSKVDHRNDIKDSLWEIQVVRREVAELRREVEQLRTKLAEAVPSPELVSRVIEVERLTKETASSLDRVLQNEVLLWQAVDAVAGDAFPLPDSGGATRCA
ncbi:hypothetical protein SAMN05421505_12259 [Sinosporangium album]|uniref:Uncharacterized protein n=2 Tax=Sinosporangium album TaxID=504805 RepID=A0A1G8F5E5_9ACTN|nr:hypothetical protein SAMN05421505_12259 [Sinosporangium album]